MSAPFFVTGREHRPVLKSIGRVLIGAIVFNALSPLSVLAQDKPVVSAAAQRQLQQLSALNQEIEQAKAARARSPAERLTWDFQQAQDLIHTLHVDTRSRAPRKPGEPDMEVRAVGPDIRIQAERSPLDKLSDERRADSESRLREHLRTLSQSRFAARADFDTTRRELLAKRVSSEILARHDAAVRDFEQRAAEFERSSLAWTNGSEEARAAALADLDDFFKRYPASRRAAPLDPRKLPWRAPEPTTRQPAETQTAWFQNLWGTPKVMLAAAGSVGPISFDVMPEPGQLPTEADLAATPETQLTPALSAKAAELGNNPLNIHNWVRNNVDWLPSWGAVQSADDTLAKKRGNAHDIASLEIALLRGAKVPARYQYGTIEVDADKLQNWVGGVSKVEAALQLLGQGGIANRGQVQGGRVAKVRMEHVWVSAYVNWMPSRGAKQGVAGQHVNPVGPLNAWVPLDPSFKQYTFAEGMNVKGAVVADPQAILNTAMQGASSSTDEGWVKNINHTALQSQLADYQNRVQGYVEGRKANFAAADVVGKKIIPQSQPSLLAGSLPYAIAQIGQQTASVATNLRHQFRFSLFLAQDGGSDFASPVLTFQESTARLAGKRLTLTYVAATQADADLIKSYLPKAHADGSPIQPGEFPSSLPGYLIRLKPQLSLNGQVVAQSATAITMGTDLISSAGFTRFANAVEWDETTAESHVAGQSTAVGLNLQGISSAQMNEITSRLDNTKAKLEINNLAGLTGEEVSGDLLNAAIWTWFSAADSHGRFAQTQADVVENPGLSYGFFHAVVQPIYSWGVVRQVKFPALNIDIPHQRSLAVAKSAAVSEWAAYNRLRGQFMSGLEHVVPERLFNHASQCNFAGAPNPINGLPNCAEGISAVKALGLASQAGQKMFTISPAVYARNPGIVQAQLAQHSLEVKNRVQSYLDAGYEVSIHERPIANAGWTGAGFVAIDTETGAGAYLIEGGSNGGTLTGLGLGLLQGFAAIIISATGLGVVAGIAGILISVIFALTTSVHEQLNFNAARFLGIVSGMALAIILFQYVAITLTPLFVLGFVFLMITILRLLIMELFIDAQT